jgi:ATP-dependent DNA helicase RecG
MHAAENAGAIMLYADEQVVENSGLKDLDLLLINEFVEKRLGDKGEEADPPLEKILNNMKILAGEKCTLAGLLLFTKKKSLLLSHFGIAAVSWYGNELGGIDYRDSEDIQGNVAKLFVDGIGFLKRQLHKLQKGQGFNSLGILEIPEVALEEALVNAIVHRDYFISSNVRLLVFDNRVEIISPGVLPNTLSVETTKTGVHIVRNPILLSHIKDIPGIPYRGMGTGISRIIKSCKEAGVNVDFSNDTEAGQFKVVFWRNPH